MTEATRPITQDPQFFTQYQSPFSYRYGTDEMRKIWSETHKWELATRVWTAVARAQHKAGLITAEEVADLEAHIGHIDFGRLMEIETKTKHDIVAGIQAFQEVAKIGGRVVHHGMTSEDVTSNVDMLRILEALVLIKTGLEKALSAFAERIEETAHTVCMGWTHMQPAEPTTVGFRLSGQAQNLNEDYKRLLWTIANVRAKGIKGAVGTSASFMDMLKDRGMSPMEMEDLVMKELGLEAALITTQIYPRKYDVWVVDALMGIGDSLYQFGLNGRILQSPPFGEWSEPRGKDQVGSSAMPWKKNPVGFENVMSLSRGALGDVINTHGVAMSQVLERGIDDSADRRITIPDIFFRIDESLKRTTHIIKGLELHPVAIERHLNNYGPFSALEKILAAAVDAGADRMALHELIREISLQAYTIIEEGKPNPLVDMIVSNTKIVKASGLSKEHILKIFQDDIRGHVGNAAERSLQLVAHIRKTIASK